ncbi:MULTISPECIES: ABC transporter ATP-binding protein [Fusobacterium]|jgi:peptide/nickel transport system ATP-binding protein|uniref:ABC transporter ATP-binding protein n=1 Tax=Fusobacterium mortiferum ATCC 9817 TaxID=469616 RepID=A0ABM6TVD8_FUSMR|nr:MULTISPECIES: ATP-binding cassette domain-containing protein [Fusobacterium]AVQ18193.1 ABC transporter ATP-binding protein [Fusobacterium mortiferum ATCC 9817]EEO36946.1 ABC transporter, ATP-binding protein [Fusobacterium mortiferum ATCC 9817]MCF2700494.1 ABC transporter ATP-binding protein [Fusobacterium mortiferum]MDD7263309.1 ATP-binding cassette domain-containing protein [Fusobacterium mortiferum]MDY4800785.1 ATP-binding cassette domain-containing protein [Fusobacterium mortiferum]
MILKVENLSKEYVKGCFFSKEKKEVLKNISFEVKEGEIFSIIGQSGVGKSTIGKIILGIEKESYGKILFLGKKLVEREKRDIQMVFQDPYSSLNAAMKVKDILAEPLKANGEKNRNEISKKVKDILEKVGLGEEFENKYPNELSGGQRQRIVIGCAMILKPKLVVCDEPVASLDLGVQKQILDLIKKFNKEYGTTFIFISHDLGVVYNISDRVMVLYKGEIQEIRETEEFFSSPQSEYGKYLLEGIR